MNDMCPISISAHRLTGSTWPLAKPTMAWPSSIGFSSFMLTYPEILVSLATFCLLLAFRHVSRRRKLPVDWPVIGMLTPLMKNTHRIHDWCTEILGDTGCSFAFKGPWGSSMDMLITADPANINHIFNTNFLNYPKGDDFSEIFDFLGDGIFNSDSELWRSQRKMALTFMHEQKFQSFMAKCIKDKVENSLIPILDRAAELEEVIDLQDVFLRFTFDTTCNLVCGIDPGCLSTDLPTVPFAKAMDDAMRAIFFRHVVPPIWWKILRWLGVGEEKKLVKAWGVVDQFIAQTIMKNRESTKEKTAPADLLTSYMNHLLQEDEAFNNKFLRDTVVNLMLAGRDTTGAALSWFFWLLWKNPDCETKILEELKANLSPQASLSDTEELEKLVYLHAALCESLRLFPPVPLEHKAILKPEFLPSGHEALPGMKILVSLYAMARMEGVWGKDCLEFKPERWISKKGRIRYEPSFKFLSFNSGPRTCLGKNIAFIQMKTVVAEVLQRFRVEVVKGHVVEPRPSIILHMLNGLKTRVAKRKERMPMVHGSQSSG